MAKRFKQPVSDAIEKCRSATIAAVEAYNRPGPQFRTAQYLILIAIAWTALFHAIFYHRGRRPWYQRKGSIGGKGTRYDKVDGEPKHWELEKCLSEYFKDQHPPERKNLEFLVGLRNKIEHRHLPNLDAPLYGECQAALLNLETILVAAFGPRYALTEQLAVSLQFSQIISPERRRAARVLASTAARSVRDYVERFRGALPSEILNDTRYSFSVYLVPKVVNRQSTADAAVEFLHIDDASPEQLERLQKLNVLIREKHIPIANLSLFKPGDVIKQLRDRLPFQISSHTHIAAWKCFKIRPASGDAHPERTSSAFCIYDAAHSDYLYTRAWVEKLAGELSTERGYQVIVGKQPKRK